MEHYFKWQCTTSLYHIKQHIAHLVPQAFDFHILCSLHFKDNKNLYRKNLAIALYIKYSYSIFILCNFFKFNLVFLIHAYTSIIFQSFDGDRCQCEWHLKLGTIYSPFEQELEDKRRPLVVCKQHSIWCSSIVICVKIVEFRSQRA